MQHPYRLALAVAGAAALAAATLTGVTANAASAPAVTTAPVAEAASTTLAYWTPARMRAAKPYPMPTLKTASRPTAQQLAVTGKASAVAGVAQSGKQAQVMSGIAQTPQSPTPQAFAYPGPYTRFVVYPTSLQRTYPWSVNGKLFFTQNGGNYVCSATSVVAPSRVRVWTAGHCLSDGAGHFNSRTVFVPAYNNGTAPFGQYVATSLTVATAWHVSGDFSRDLGAFRVGPNAAGQNLTTMVGSSGFAWNQSRDQQFTAVAYPAAAPFNGLVPWEMHTSTATSASVGSGPAAVGVGSDYTGGSSGGSWRISAGGAYVGYVNGHNDFKFTNGPLQMFSPYLDSLANSVRCAGEVTGNGCP